MQQLPKFQHNHHPHHNQTSHHHNQHHQGGHINHQYNHSGGALPNAASHFAQNHQNGIADGQHDDMDEPGGEHWQAQQQWAEEARANASPHHQARTVAQVSKHLNLGVSQPGTDENQEEERNRPVAVSKSSRQGWTAIDLGGQGLRALSDALFRYEFLQKLYLNHNNIDHLPTTIGRLKSLVELDVSGNQLRELPAEIGMLTNLERLMLVDNHLRTLPFEVGHLYKLSVLGVEGNPLNEDDMKLRVMRMSTKDFIEYLRDEMPGELSCTSLFTSIIDSSFRSPTACRS
jgi:CCR4-NOT transcription complex subunit 6